MYILLSRFVFINLFLIINCSYFLFATKISALKTLHDSKNIHYIVKAAL